MSMTSFEVVFWALACALCHISASAVSASIFSANKNNLKLLPEAKADLRSILLYSEIYKLTVDFDWLIC